MGEERARFLELLPKGAICAEIGVFRGEYSAKILEHTKPAELHLIDYWWTSWGDNYPDWGEYTDHGRLSTRQAYADVMAQVAAHKGDAKVEIHVGNDCEILEGFRDAYFDWVYLDTGHKYEETLRELEVLSRKVKPSGIIAGDDWQDDPAHPHYGCGLAVREFCEGTRWRVIERDDCLQWLLRQEAV